MYSFKLKGTKEFRLGCLAQDIHPNSPFWIDLFSSSFVKDIISNGRIIKNYEDKKAEENLSSFGFKASFEGYRCFCLNRKCNSEYFKSAGDYDIYISFIYTGKNWLITLFSSKVDVSKIAKRYGGGGHKGAAGFSSKSLSFLNF